MKPLKLTLLTVFFALIAANTYFHVAANSQFGNDPTAGFDNKTNGMLDQQNFDKAREVFEERDDIAKGLGPVFNAQSCAECHQSPVTGAISQITEFRAGHKDQFGNFVDAPGGSLINDRAVHPDIQEFASAKENVRSFRTSLNILGDGYVEAIDDNTLIEIARNQPRLSLGKIAGQVIRVPVKEAPGVTRVGRFGWKNQHASLLSFAADAYLNEIGITSRLEPNENTSMGNSVAAYDAVPGIEDADNDIDVFAQFMRSTKAPSRHERESLTADARNGAQYFDQVGCAICHVTSFTTAPAGTSINGGKFIIPAALGSKEIHPYGDFLLHDIGTGDGIVQNGGQSTANKMRTAPLWGLRTHNRYMHDGESLTLEDAISRHNGEASLVKFRYYITLNELQRAQMMKFLRSL